MEKETETISYAELFDMMCAFARQCDNEVIFISTMSAVFKARTEEYKLDMIPYINCFAKFMSEAEKYFDKE